MVAISTSCLSYVGGNLKATPTRRAHRGTSEIWGCKRFDQRLKNLKLYDNYMKHKVQLRL